MGGRRRVAGGFSAWLPDHRSREGHEFRRAIAAALEITGPINGSERLRLEVRQYAIASLMHSRAATTWAELVHARETGAGRRPTWHQIDRAAKRTGLAAITLREVTARLEALAARHPPTPDQLLDRAHREMGAELQRLRAAGDDR
jgi:hypothetical protein